MPAAIVLQCWLELQQLLHAYMPCLILVFEVRRDSTGSCEQSDCDDGTTGRPAYWRAVCRACTKGASTARAEAWV